MKSEKNPLTAFICAVCRQANKTKAVHPGVLHTPGICDCKCRD